jgi:hypothetical protein
MLINCINNGFILPLTDKFSDVCNFIKYYLELVYIYIYTYLL